MNILIDDHRTHLPDGTVPDIILRNATAATNFLMHWHFWAEDDALYLDHDMGPNAYADWAGSGYDVLTWLEEWKQRNPKYELPGKMIVVSDNPAGRLRMELVIGKLYGADARV